MSTLVSPDIEGVVVGWLKQELTARGNNVSVTRYVPAQRPSRFVTVSQVGGSRSQRVIGYGMVSVQCWDTPSRRGDAGRLANLCEGLLYDLEQITFNGVWIRSITGSGGGVAYFPDGLTDASRFQFTAELNCKLLDT